MYEKIMVEKLFTKKQVQEVPIKKEPSTTYILRMSCTNCGYEMCRKISKGAVRPYEIDCYNCGCKSTAYYP